MEKTNMFLVPVQSSCIMIAAFSYNYTMLLLMFFFIGIVASCVFTISPSYEIELFPRSYRGFSTGNRVVINILANMCACLIALAILPKRFNIFLGALHFAKLANISSCALNTRINGFCHLYLHA